VAGRVVEPTLRRETDLMTYIEIDIGGVLSDDWNADELMIVC